MVYKASGAGKKVINRLLISGKILFSAFSRQFSPLIFLFFLYSDIFFASSFLFRDSKCLIFTFVYGKIGMFRHIIHMDPDFIHNFFSSQNLCFS